MPDDTAFSTSSCETPRQRHWSLRAFASVVAVMLVGVGDANGATTTLDDQGREIFNRSCGNGHCHGTDGSGAGGPRLSGRSDLTSKRVADALAKGIPGTRMRSFAGELGAGDVSRLTAFLTRRANGPSAGSNVFARNPDSGRGQPGKKVQSVKAPSSGVADVARGERIFFDLAREGRCSACHTYFGRGGTAAADLTDAASWPAWKLAKAVSDPSPTKYGRSRTIALITSDGAMFKGLLRDEVEDTVRIVDVTGLPVVHRSFTKAQLASITRLPAADLLVHAGLSARELLDVVAYVRSRDGQLPVTLRPKDMLPAGADLLKR